MNKAVTKLPNCNFVFNISCGVSVSLEKKNYFKDTRRRYSEQIFIFSVYIIDSS